MPTTTYVLELTEDEIGSLYELLKVQIEMIPEQMLYPSELSTFKKVKNLMEGT